MKNPFFRKTREKRRKRKELMNEILGEVHRRENWRPVPSVAEECDSAIAWYAKAGWKSKRNFFLMEVAIVIAGAAVSLVSVVLPDPKTWTAILGFVVVIGTSLRQSFHWQENFVRFTIACQRLKAAKRIYNVGKVDSDDKRLDEQLVRVVNETEAEETQGWVVTMKTRGEDSGR
jgi:hypothetical protein